MIISLCLLCQYRTVLRLTISWRHAWTWILVNRILIHLNHYNTKAHKPKSGNEMQTTMKLLSVHPQLLPEGLELSKHFCLLFDDTWRKPGYLSLWEARAACFLLSHNPEAHCASSASSLTIVEYEDIIFLTQSHLSYSFQGSSVLLIWMPISHPLKVGWELQQLWNYFCHSCTSWRHSLGLQSLRKWPIASCTVCSTSLMYTVRWLVAIAHQSWHTSPHTVL